MGSSNGSRTRDRITGARCRDPGAPHMRVRVFPPARLAVSPILEEIVLSTREAFCSVVINKNMRQRRDALFFVLYDLRITVRERDCSTNDMTPRQSRRAVRWSRSNTAHHHHSSFVCSLTTTLRVRTLMYSGLLCPHELVLT